MSIAMSPAQASALPSDLRNSIYSSLLSSGGIRTIESTLTQLLQTTGFQASLRAYMTDLFRTGHATTANEAYSLAMNRIKECMADVSDKKTNGLANGEPDGPDGLDLPDLTLPSEVVTEGTKVVRRELERVVTIEMD